MSTSQEAETSPARGHSPRFRWFLLWCLVLYYALYGTGLAAVVEGLGPASSYELWQTR